MADLSGLSDADLIRLIQQAHAQAPEQPTEQPNALVDVARSIPGGLAKGAAATGGMFGDIPKFAHQVLRTAASFIPGGPQAVDVASTVASNIAPPAPTSAQLNATFSAPTGGYYEPKTTPGKYAETIASFAPAALAPGSAAQRVARVVVPGAASEFGGQVTAGTPLEPYGRMAGAILGGGAEQVGERLAPYVAEAANRAAASFGHEFMDPNAVAVQRLQAAIRRDGGVQAVQGNLDRFTNAGSESPSLLDVSGNNVLRLTRGAAQGAEGEAQNLALDYARRTLGNVQDRAVNAARGLTPNDTLTAPQYASALENVQGQLADEQYREPYAQPAAVTPEMVSALQGPEGRAAINQAYVTARANRDAQAMGELWDLRQVAADQGGGINPLTGQKQSIEQALSNLSARSLDRVRIAMREMARGFAANNKRGLAAGYFGRMNDIDTALDQTPGLQEARSTYRNLAQQREAVDTGLGALNTPSDLYGPQVQGMSEDARRAAGVGYRQAIVDAIQRPAEGSTGTLNRLATSTQQTNNLGATFGEDAAQRFQDALNNEIARVSRARTISPNTGSQTQLRGADETLVQADQLLHGGMLSRMLSLVRSGATLTPAQRAEIVRLATRDGDLTRLLQSPAAPPAQPTAQMIALSRLLANPVQDQRH